MSPPILSCLRGLSLAGVMALVAVASVLDVDAKTAARAPSKEKSFLEVDHLMIHVAPGAPERGALERTGFRIAPELNQHEGQGIASITVELENGFVELTWRDTSVSVNPGLESVATRFERQGEWRSSGWSPFGIGLRRSKSAPDSLPFPTRAVRGPWMAPGDYLQIISAINDTAGPRLWVVPRSMAANGRRESDSERRRLANPENFAHANRAAAITGVKMFAPAAALSPATEVVARNSPVVFVRSSEWLLDVTFDRGYRGVTRDLRPELPLVCHF